MTDANSSIPLVPAILLTEAADGLSDVPNILLQVNALFDVIRAGLEAMALDDRRLITLAELGVDYSELHATRTMEFYDQFDRKYRRATSSGVETSDPARG